MLNPPTASLTDLGVLKVKGDGNCGPRAIIQSILVQGVLQNRNARVVNFIKKLIKRTEISVKNSYGLDKPATLDNFISHYGALTIGNLGNFSQSFSIENLNSVESLLNKNESEASELLNSIAPNPYINLVDDYLVYFLSACLRKDMASFNDPELGSLKNFMPDLDKLGDFLDIETVQPYLNLHNLQLVVHFPDKNDAIRQKAVNRKKIFKVSEAELNLHIIYQNKHFDVLVFKDQLDPSLLNDWQFKMPLQIEEYEKAVKDWQIQSNYETARKLDNEAEMLKPNQAIEQAQVNQAAALQMSKQANEQDVSEMSNQTNVQLQQNKIVTKEMPNQAIEQPQANQAAVLQMSKQANEQVSEMSNQTNVQLQQNKIVTKEMLKQAIEQAQANQAAALQMSKRANEQDVSEMSNQTNVQLQQNKIVTKEMLKQAIEQAQANQAAALQMSKRANEQHVSEMSNQTNVQLQQNKIVTKEMLKQAIEQAQAKAAALQMSKQANEQVHENKQDAKVLSQIQRDKEVAKALQIHELELFILENKISDNKNSLYLMKSFIDNLGLNEEINISKLSKNCYLSKNSVVIDHLIKLFKLTINKLGYSSRFRDEIKEQADNYSPTFFSSCGQKMPNTSQTLSSQCQTVK